MLYLDFSDNTIEAVKTNKSLIGGEKIVGCTRKQLTESLLLNGLILKPEALVQEIQSLLNSAYPKPIKESEVCLTIPDEQTILHRFILSTKTTTDISKMVIEEVKKTISLNPEELENFYKVVKKSAEEEEILYTAAPKTSVLAWEKVFKMLGLRLSFLSSSSFGIFSLLQFAISNEEKIIHCEIENQETNYFVFDKFGPLLTLKKKHQVKSFTTEIKGILKKLEEEKKIKIAKIVLGGEGSIEINGESLKEEVGIVTAKMGDIIEQILTHLKLNFDSGGVSKMLLAKGLGIIDLVRNPASPNFAKDLKFLAKEFSPLPKSEPILSQSLKEGPEENKQSPPAVAPPMVDNSIMSGQIVEYKKTNLLQILSKKVFLAILLLVGLFAILGGAFVVLGKSSVVKLPFMTSPTPTPTITLTPTMTPFPTLDPKLKRSEIKVSVQNGTDKTGYAKEIASILEKKGYKNVAKANADRDTYEKTIIKIKEAKSNYLPLLLTDLKETFDISSFETLEENSEHDAVVILGKK